MSAKAARDDPPGLRLAFADPPYLGQAKLYPEHPEAARWNEPAAHGDLMHQMERDYDGWAFSCSTPSLQVILPLAPDGVRVAAWVKPFASYKPGLRVAYTWEPVIFREARTKSDRVTWTVRDHFSHRITFERGLPGAKPERFCRWVLDLLGYVEGDTVDDLFPGTAVMDAVLRQGVIA